jgi:16S rRNA pseudouridine516 synthase
MTRPPSIPPTLGQILFAQGFGTRRDCDALVRCGEVAVEGRVVVDPGERFVADRLTLTVQGQPWQCHEQALVMLNKPSGYECSTRPSGWPSVLLLLPAPLRRRGLQPVGRLDQDTTGLLLLTDDGSLIHRLSSPKHKVPKVYELATDRPVDPAQVGRLLEGVVLDDGPVPVRAQACEITGERGLRLTLVQGKYHQVKRMVAAVGNHVTALHRSAYGALALPAELAPGQWRWVDDIQAVTRTIP